MPSGSLLKNDHLRRFSCPLAGPSSLRRTVEYTSLLRISGAPANGISQSSTCICLPARSRFGEGRVLFEQPAKNDFFSSLPEVNLLTCSGSVVDRLAKNSPQFSANHFAKVDYFTPFKELRETITLKEFFGLTNAWCLLYSYASSVASNSLNILRRFSGYS